MALATLYGHSLDLRTVDLSLAKGLVAAGSLLGLEAVAASGVKALLANLSKATIGEAMAFALSRQPTAFPGEIVPSIDMDVFYPGPYPIYTKSLVQILVDFILVTFNASETPLDPVYLDLLLSLPFPILKHICENEKLTVNGHMGRHQFASEIAANRQSKARKNMKSGQGPIFEENAILSFSNGKGKVELIRRPVGKKKVLWKAGQK